MSQRPRILIDLSVLNHQRPTGLGRFSLQLTRALAQRQGLAITTLLGPSEHHPELKGIPALPVEIPANDSLEAQKELTFWAHQSRAQIVFGTYFPVPTQRRSFRSVLTIHDLIPLKLPDLYKGYLPYVFVDGPLRRCAQQADAIITPSQSAKDDVVELYGIKPNRIHVIVEGADERFHTLPGPDPLWSQVQRRYGIRGPYLLSLCAFSIQKNLPRILEAFAIAKRQRWAAELQLVLAGMAGSSQLVLQKALREHPYRRHIIHTGYVPDSMVPTLYRHATAFVAPSLYEGFGLPMLEAMKCGTAVVTSTLSSIPEVVGGTSFPCDAYSPASIARAMRQAVTDEPLRRQKIAAALRRAQRFTWARAAQQVHAVFQKLL